MGMLNGGANKAGKAGKTKKREPKSRQELIAISGLRSDYSFYSHKSKTFKKNKRKGL